MVEAASLGGSCGPMGGAAARGGKEGPMMGFLGRGDSDADFCDGTAPCKLFDREGSGTASADASLPGPEEEGCAPPTPPAQLPASAAFFSSAWSESRKRATSRFTNDSADGASRERYRFPDELRREPGRASRNAPSEARIEGSRRPSIEIDRPSSRVFASCEIEMRARARGNVGGRRANPIVPHRFQARPYESKKKTFDPLQCSPRFRASTTSPTGSLVRTLTTSSSRAGASPSKLRSATRAALVRSEGERLRRRSCDPRCELERCELERCELERWESERFEPERCASSLRERSRPELERRESSSRGRSPRMRSRRLTSWSRRGSCSERPERRPGESPRRSLELDRAMTTRRRAPCENSGRVEREQRQVRWLFARARARARARAATASSHAERYVSVVSP